MRCCTYCFAVADTRSHMSFVSLFLPPSSREAKSFLCLHHSSQFEFGKRTRSAPPPLYATMVHGTGTGSSSSSRESNGFLSISLVCALLDDARFVTKGIRVCFFLVTSHSKQKNTLEGKSRAEQSTREKNGGGINWNTHLRALLYDDDDNLNKMCAPVISAILIFVVVALVIQLRGIEQRAAPSNTVAVEQIQSDDDNTQHVTASFI